MQRNTSSQCKLCDFMCCGGAKATYYSDIQITNKIIRNKTPKTLPTKYNFFLYHFFSLLSRRYFGRKKKRRKNDHPKCGSLTFRRASLFDVCLFSYLVCLLLFWATNELLLIA